MIKKFKFGGTLFSVNKKGNKVKIQMGDEIRYIDTLKLWGMVFEFTKDEEMRAQMMPVQKKEMMKFKKVHQVQVKNDMKAGDTLTFTCNIDVPTLVIDGMRDIISKEVPGAQEILAEIIPLSTAK